MFVAVLVSTLIACVAAHNGLVPMLDGRIVGGDTTVIERYPHQISMRYMWSHRCGGSIISPNIVISAAHCVDGIYFQSLLKIRAGTTFKGGSGFDAKVREIIIHEGYNSATVENDISILKLSDSFEFSAQIQPIALPEFGEKIAPGSLGFVSGWGATSEGGFSSDQLKAVGVLIIEHSECVNAYKNANAITETMICAGQIGGGSDACQGDSGGPFVAEMSDKQTKLIGVVSWGYGCARPEYPGVYADVSVLRPWIDSKLENLF